MRVLSSTLLALVVSVLSPVDARAELTAIEHKSGIGYDWYHSTATGDTRTSEPRPGVLMMGGGDYFPAAFQWLFERGGHGHLVVLRASGEGELNPFFIDEIGGVAQVDTVVFSRREASSDPVVLDIVRAADMIFIAGGDQANYVNYWRGTPMQEAINAHVAAGRPIGGTSAGLAVQGRWLYGALDGGSITAPETLSDPLGAGNTLIDGFLRLPHLQDVITDSHFTPRDRLGRLIGWLARLRAQPGNERLIGIGVDEATALAVEGDGSARVLRAGDGQVWLVEPTKAASLLEAGEPLRIEDVCVTALDPDSRLQLPTGKREDHAGQWIVEAAEGKLSRREAACP